MPIKQVDVRKHRRKKPTGGTTSVRKHTRRVHGADPKLFRTSKKVSTKRPTWSSGRTREKPGKNAYALLSASPVEIIYRDDYDTRLVIDKRGSQWRMREFKEDKTGDDHVTATFFYTSKRRANMKALQLIKSRTGQKPYKPHGGTGGRGYY